MRLFAFIVLFCFMVNPANAATYYIANFTTENASHAGTIDDPFQTWYQALGDGSHVGVAGPGDTVEVACGATYPISMYVDVSGSLGNPITIIGNCTVPSGTSMLTKGANASPAKITGTTVGSSGIQNAIQIHLGMHDLVFRNIEISATTTNKNGFFLETDPSHVVLTHDITADFMLADNNSCGSFEFDGADYITVTNSVAHDNGATCTIASESGIHLYQLTNQDTVSGVHNLISGNIIFNESKGAGSIISDGMGTELDDGDGTQGSHCTNWGASKCPYTNQTTIQNNIIYTNDGDCHHNFETAAPTEFVNNTCYHNDQNQVSGSVWGEVTWSNSSQAATGSAYNNIIIPKTTSYLCGRASSSSTGTSTITYNANDCFGSTSHYSQVGSATLVQGAANVTGDPNLISPVTNFSTQAVSAAQFSAIGAFAPPNDIFGTSRPSAGVGCTAAVNPTIGAIQ